MADQAMHDLDYKAQLEQSAHAHSNAIELAELNKEIEKGMTAMRKWHIDDEKGSEFRRQTWRDELNDIRQPRPITVFTVSYRAC